MRIVAFAYACEPARGSEPGAGWAWARMLARMGETWVITRRDYQDSIQAALSSIPERENLHFVYAELPERFRRLATRPQRTARLLPALADRGPEGSHPPPALQAIRRCVAPDVGYRLVWNARLLRWNTVRVRTGWGMCRHRLAVVSPDGLEGHRL